MHIAHVPDDGDKTMGNAAWSVAVAAETNGIRATRGIEG